MKQVYLIGIGGSGMEPLASFALQAGYQVTGSDPGIAPEKYAKLMRAGARVFRNHDAGHLDAWLDGPADASPGRQTDASTDHAARVDDRRDGTGERLVVYSSAIPADHVERARAAELAAAGRLRLLHRMDFLNHCLAGSPETLCVAGTHGKTSSSAMLGWVLLGLGLDPHIVVGGRPLYLPEGVRYGGGRTGVCETDESDGSFLKAGPGLRLILNVDRDHLDHYGDFAELCRAFGQFARAGRLSVVNAGDPELVDLLADPHRIDPPAGQRALFYGYQTIAPLAEQPEYPQRVQRSERVQLSKAAVPPGVAQGRTYTGTFEPDSDRMQVCLPADVAQKTDGIVGRLQLKMPGRHFAANALGVFALVDASVRHGLLRCPDYRPARVLELLGEFPGVERRMEYLGDLGGARVYDDYGHHPTEIAAVLDACRLRLGQRGRVVAVFQPHRYTRTRALFREFAEVLRRADLIFLLPLYSAGEAPIEGVGSALIRGAGGAITSSVADGVAPEASPASGGRFTLLEQPDSEARFAAVFAEVRPGDLVICLGAGDISAGIRQYLAVALQGLQP